MDLSTIIAKRPTKTVYKDGNSVIKMMDESHSASDVLNEALNLSIVYETGFKVPNLIEVVKHEGKWAIVTEYVEGQTIAELIAEHPAKTDEYFSRFLDVQLEMHAYSAERLRHLTDKLQNEISKSGLDASTRYELHIRLNGITRHNKLCHGDFVPENVVITPSGEACVLDWAHATQGNASADAARTYLRFMLAGKDAYAEKYIGLFCKKSDTARQYVQKWMSVVAVSQLAKETPEERELLMKWVNVAEYQ
jgi:RIO-like serine/threonine protein kinase